MINISEKMINISDLQGLIVKDEKVAVYYEVSNEPIGRGKYANVHLCEHMDSGEQYAGKFFRKYILRKEKENIYREIEMLHKTKECPYVVKIIEVFDTPQEIAIITELAPGGELFRKVTEKDGCPEPIVKKWMQQILKGLAHIHDLNIVHMDMKPQNILLTHEDIEKADVKLCDFGFAQTITGKPITVPFGTPDFMAPEMLDCGVVDAKTDMWSVGVVVYMLLSGLSPFVTDVDETLPANLRSLQIMSNIAQRDFQYPDYYFQHVSSEAINFIEALLKLNKRDRLSARQCLEHKWFDEQATQDNRVSSSAESSCNTTLSTAASNPGASPMATSPSPTSSSAAATCKDFELNIQGIPSAITAEECSSSSAIAIVSKSTSSAVPSSLLPVISSSQSPCGSPIGGRRPLAPSEEPSSEAEPFKRQKCAVTSLPSSSGSGSSSQRSSMTPSSSRSSLSSFRTAPESMDEQQWDENVSLISSSSSDMSSPSTDGSSSNESTSDNSEASLREASTSSTISMRSTEGSSSSANAATLVQTATSEESATTTTTTMTTKMVNGNNNNTDDDVVVVNNGKNKRSNGDITNGIITNGIITNGDITNNNITNGNLPNGNVPNGIITNGHMNGNHVVIDQSGMQDYINGKVHHPDQPMEQEKENILVNNNIEQRPNVKVTKITKIASVAQRVKESELLIEQKKKNVTQTSPVKSKSLQKKFGTNH